MTLNYRKLALALSLLVLPLATLAHSAVLWDQSTIDINGPGIANSNSPGFGGFVIWSVNDVTVPAGGWTITSITEYYSLFNFSWTGITQGYLYVQPKTGALPTIVPVGPQIPMSGAIGTPQFGQEILEVRAAGLNIALAPGQYWIGIAPTAGAGINGANQQWPAAMVGDSVASYAAPGPWTNFYGNYDGAMKIEGDLPVPVTSITWSGVKALYR